MFTKGLSYDDVLLRPQYSDIESRSEINLSSDLGKGLNLNLPIFASPMDTISESGMGAALQKAGGAAIIHRYNTIEEQMQHVRAVTSLCTQDSFVNLMIGGAVGVTGDYLERAQALRTMFVKFVCVDVAHGHHSLMKKALHNLRKVLGEGTHIMAGNVATLEGFNDLADWGADSVRCNIGGGSICSTRIQTGHGIPGFHTIVDCARSDRDVRIIADGGIKNSGDIVKALAAGADAVMCGSLFAGTAETPGQIFEDIDGTKWKSYRGMASKEAQVQWHGRYSSHEGVATRVPYRGSVADVLGDLERGMRSGFSYSGARDITELQCKAQFIEQTASGLSESRTHITNRKWK
jgi:IMP dehydrogenase